MEFYFFAESADTLTELSSTSLAHLYFVKVQAKPTGYDDLDVKEKNDWTNSRMKTIRRYTKKTLIDGLIKAVRVSWHLYFCTGANKR
jgi:hypothetical protein